MNAKVEFLKLIGKKIVAAAEITKLFSPEEGEETTIKLFPGFSEEEFKNFLQEINGFIYDEGYGTQELGGTVWFHDGSWADRHEYDGSECWIIRSRPPLPRKS
jgi:hypothetical protein